MWVLHYGYNVHHLLKTEGNHWDINEYIHRFPRFQEIFQGNVMRI